MVKTHTRKHREILKTVDGLTPLQPLAWNHRMLRSRSSILNAAFRGTVPLWNFSPSDVKEFHCPPSIPPYELYFLLLCHRVNSVHLFFPSLGYCYISFFFLAGGPSHFSEIALSTFPRSLLGRADILYFRPYPFSQTPFFLQVLFVVHTLLL